jgi:hypothetical protein
MFRRHATGSDEGAFPALTRSASLGEVKISAAPPAARKTTVVWPHLGGHATQETVTPREVYLVRRDRMVWRAERAAADRAAAGGRV